MTQYAIDDVRPLVNGLPTPIDDRRNEVRYLCSLFSELAYYHVPAWEIDDKKRAKLIPCDAYRSIVDRGTPTDVLEFARQRDFERSFVAADRGSIAVGVFSNRLLFIGFRGTQFLFDWRVNLRSRLVPIESPIRARPPFYVHAVRGHVHSGFAEEALRISIKILDAIRDANFGEIDHVFLTGHSLGGAVAAISENFIRVAPTSVCMFGAPRYSDVSAYATLPDGPPTQVLRTGDLVPTVPPRRFGYADHPYEFGTDGRPYMHPQSLLPSGDVWRWLRFLGRQFEPHSMESYRHELGKTASAPGATAPLAPVERLVRADVKS